MSIQSKFTQPCNISLAALLDILITEEITIPRIISVLNIKKIVIFN